MSCFCSVSWNKFVGFLSLSLSHTHTHFCLQESSSLGLPVVRPLFLHYWEDPRSLAITYQQFLVGSEILVAPVLDKGHGHVWTYFPSSPDEWTHVWTGTLYSHRPSLVKIQSPLGYPAIFVKSNSPVGHTFLQNLRDLHLMPEWRDGPISLSFRLFDPPFSKVQDQSFHTIDPVGCSPFKRFTIRVFTPLIW